MSEIVEELMASVKVLSASFLGTFTYILFMFTVRPFLVYVAKTQMHPEGATLVYGKTASKGVIKWCANVGHFEIHYGLPFEIAMQDYMHFLQVFLSLKHRQEA